MHAHARFIAVLFAILATGGCNDSSTARHATMTPSAAQNLVVHSASIDTTRGAPVLARIARDAIVAHAPYKQVNAANGAPNREIGRTPGAACDAILFLDVWGAVVTQDKDASERRDELVAWVRGLQDRASATHGIASVPSTPDLQPPADRFYYAIDAALCGRAMLALHRSTGDQDALGSAVGFGGFLVELARRQAAVFQQTGAVGGFCEYATPVDGRLAYNCDSHVKNLLATGFLRELASKTGQPEFASVAEAARRFLLPGLSGGWEFADAEAALGCDGRCELLWRRIPGPHGEPDRYVYGDTVAYALAGLHVHDGPTEELRRIYDMFRRYAADAPETRNYRGDIAFAGYLDVPARAPDRFSAYYDLVTAGVLGPLRRAIDPADDAEARSFVERRLLASGSLLTWGVGFDGQSIGIDYLDLTTLATLGLWALQAE